MSDAMAPVPHDHPLMLAWGQYRNGEDYENTRRWAAHDEHRDGSLWAAFEAGWKAGRYRLRSPETQDALREIEEYFDQRADAEYFTDRAGPVGNEEMRHLAMIRSLLLPEEG